MEVIGAETVGHLRAEGSWRGNGRWSVKGENEILHVKNRKGQGVRKSRIRLKMRENWRIERSDRSTVRHGIC